MRDTTFFEDGSRRAVGFFNLWLALEFCVAFVAPLGEVAAVGHADDGKAKGERREEKPDEPHNCPLPHVHPLATAESTMSAVRVHV